MRIQSLLVIGLLLALLVGASLAIASANASLYRNDSCWAPFNCGRNSVLSYRAVLNSSVAPLTLRDALAAVGSPHHKFVRSAFRSARVIVAPPDGYFPIGAR
jgi:hypothetical protein